MVWRIAPLLIGLSVASGAVGTVPDPDGAATATADLSAALGAGPTLPGFADLAARAVALADAAPEATPAEILAATESLLAAHARAAEALVPGAGLHRETLPALRAQRAWVEGAQELLDRRGSGATDAEMVLAVLALQAPPVATPALPALPRFDGLEAAVLALFEHTGLAPTAEHRAILEAYGSVPPELAAALTRIVEGHLFMMDATRLAYDHPSRGFAFDEPLLLAARERFAHIVLENAPPLAPLRTEPPALVVCEDDLFPGSPGVIILNLGEDDSYYDCDAPLILDVGGNDHYANNAGGNLRPGESGLLVDPDGTDTFACFRDLSALNGGGFDGAGHLFDLAGDDTFAPVKGVEAAIDGGGVNGTGLLVDLVGNDTHWPQALGGALNGGGVRGVGTLIDLAGNDAYSGALHASGAANGGSLDGRGLLVDLAGFDGYSAPIEGAGGANGGALGGEAVLLDLEGETPEGWTADPWEPFQANVEGPGAGNGAAVGGSGLLLNAGGSDSYTGTVGGVAAINGAAVLGVGTLIDLEGDINYFLATTGTLSATNGGAIGALEDGSDEPSPPGAVGLLLSTGAGGGEYGSEGVTQGGGLHYGVGILLDLAGDDGYQARDGSLGQGAGRQGGLGLLLDTSGYSAMGFTSGAGQAYGDQGIGILLRPDETNTTNFGNYLPSVTGRARGAGIAILLSPGETYFQQYPATECTAEALEDPVDAGGTHVRLCDPDPENATDVINPATGEPVGPLYKPPVPCRETTVGPANCGEAADEHLGPNASDWLASSEVTTTTSGALQYFLYPPEPGADPERFLILVVMMADRGCDVGCSPF